MDKPRVRVDFEEAVNGVPCRVWSEVGFLESKSCGFVLHVFDHTFTHPNGSRVFPLGGRRAEVYFLDAADGADFVCTTSGVKVLS